MKQVAYSTQPEREIRHLGALFINEDKGDHETDHLLRAPSAESSTLR